MDNAQKRFRDNGELIWEVFSPCLVRCPRCERCAEVTRVLEDKKSPTAWRLICPSCAFAKEVMSSSPHTGLPEDPYFKAKLWLQTPCCGETLWAYSLRHLDLMERYVSAEIREAHGVPGRGPMNASLVSRLPAWIIAAKNRPEVLKGLERLKKVMMSA